MLVSEDMEVMKFNLANKISALLFFLLSSLSFPANAGDTVIFYINGAFNSNKNTAQESIKRFRQVLVEEQVYSTPVLSGDIIDYSYWVIGNYSDPGEITIQQATSNTALIKARESGAIRPLHLTNEYLYELGGIYDFTINDATVPINLLWNDYYSVTNQTSILAKKIEDFIFLSDSKIVFVAHSQGNLYLESALAYLQFKYGKNALKNIRVISLGSVSASTYNNKYISLKQDKYVAGGYKFGQLFDDGEFSLLEANTLACSFLCTESSKLPFSLIEITGDRFLHGAVATYFNEKVLDSATLTALPKLIASYVKSAIEELNPPQNLLLGSTVTDSCPSTSCPYNTHGNPNNITDGNKNTYRGIDSYSGSFNIFLNSQTTLSRLVITPDMEPDGTVYYEIQTSNDPRGAIGTWTSHGQKSSVWRNHEDFSVSLNSNTTGVRVVKVIIHSSPHSLIFLSEVQGFAQ